MAMCIGHDESMAHESPDRAPEEDQDQSVPDISPASPPPEPIRRGTEVGVQSVLRRASARPRYR
jgi:hypothetical protein